MMTKVRRIDDANLMHGAVVAEILIVERPKAAIQDPQAGLAGPSIGTGGNFTVADQDMFVRDCQSPRIALLLIAPQNVRSVGIHQSAIAAVAGDEAPGLVDPEIVYACRAIYGPPRFLLEGRPIKLEDIRAFAEIVSHRVERVAVAMK